MKKDVLIIGASILDVLCLPTSSDVFDVGSYPCDDISLSYFYMFVNGDVIVVSV